ncbi:MAG: glutamine--tRNA ligase, partial [Planctomycetota bacterium]
SLPAEVRLYDRLMLDEDEGEEEDLMARLNPDSLETLAGCRVEPSLAGAEPGARYQFERKGYFGVDPDTSAEMLVFNRTVSLRDKWARIQREHVQRAR